MPVTNTKQTQEEQKKRDKEAISKVATPEALKGQATTARATTLNYPSLTSQETQTEPIQQDEGAEAIRSAGMENYNAFSDMMLEHRADYEREMKERDAEIAASKRAAMWTGGAEAVASLINLIGVATGGSNQTIKSYSQDWMKKADEQTRERRNRFAEMRDRQRQMKAQLAQMKYNNGISLANYYSNKARQQAEERAAQEKAGIEKFKAETGRINAVAKIDNNAKNNEIKAKVAESQIQKNKAAAEKYRNGGAVAKGSGKSYRMSVFTSESTEEPDLYEFANLDDLKNTIAANYKNETAFSDGDRKEINKILQMNMDKSPEQQMNLLLPYISKSELIQKALQKSANNYTKGKPKPPVPPAVPTGTTGSSPLQPAVTSFEDKVNSIFAGF